MVLTPLIKRQLRIFAVLAAVALGMMVVVYARVPASLGVGVYDVKVEFADSTGLYPKALVTYRGVKVGVVSSLKLSDDAAVATMRLTSGTKIPRDVTAELHSTSAIGEQFIDLVPKTAKGPYLEGDETIPRTRTVEMPQITPVLDSVNHLLESVPLEATTRVLDQVDQGLGSSGRDVGELIDSSQKVIAEAQSQIDATTGLVTALEPVLKTQARLTPDTLAYASSLKNFTSELASHDADLRALLRQGGPGIDSTRETVNDLQATLPMLLQNTRTNAQVLNTYLPQLEQILVVYPATVARLQSAVNPRAAEGDVQLDLRAGVNNPKSCIKGYQSASTRRSPAATSVRSVDLAAHCEEAPQAPEGIRGSRNLPCPNSSARGALPADCGLHFGAGRWPAGVDRNAASTATSNDTDEVEASSERAWTRLFLQPLGLW
jgi:phospholipid/cholesterol/gamma-HCH transport system substrate-binding protein